MVLYLHAHRKRCSYRFNCNSEQREYMYHRVRDLKVKPIFLLDFWNDGEYVHGCIAGGRRYLHINANGDVEPVLLFTIPM